MNSKFGFLKNLSNYYYFNSFVPKYFRSSRISSSSSSRIRLCRRSISLTVPAAVVVYCQSKEPKSEDPTIVPKTLQDCWDIDENDLSHRYLIRQANVLASDSVSRILNETLSAIQDIHVHYRIVMNEMMDLLNESQTACGVHLEAIDAQIIDVRDRLDLASKNIVELDIYLNSVKKLVESVVETAFLAGAEYASICMSERILSADLEMKRVKDETKFLEAQLNEFKSLIIRIGSKDKD